MNQYLLTQPHPLQHITLQSLRQRNNQMDQAIQLIQSRINYIRNKQFTTFRKTIVAKKKNTSLELIRKKVTQQAQLETQHNQRHQQLLSQKIQYNNLINHHLKLNKKIVMGLINQKVTEETKRFKQKNQQLKQLAQVLRETVFEQNIQKVNKVRTNHTEAHQKRKLYFLEKLNQFKTYKQHKLKQQIKQRERQSIIVQELQQKQRILLEKLYNSQKFRMKCQEEYEEARRKHKSFYEASRAVSRDNHLDQCRADIFIS